MRPGVRLEWYIKPDLMLDTEVGYEWLSQDFQSDTLWPSRAMWLWDCAKGSDPSRARSGTRPAPVLPTKTLTDRSPEFRLRLMDAAQ